VLPARATVGLELALFLGLASPLLAEWFETTSASSRLSYALLVPALALVLALRAGRGQDGGGRDPYERPAPRHAAFFAALAALAFLGGSLSGVFTLALCAVPLSVVAFVARWGGEGALRRHAPALALLFLMVPPPVPILDRVTPLLTRASGATAAGLLAPLDAHASWAGATLSFRGWTLIVAEACSGSGTLLMLGTLCAFLAGLFRLRLARALGLIALAVPVALAVNGVRIASSALVIDRFGAAAGQGLAHELLGQGVVVAGVALLVVAVERCAARTALART
jgi:exosortase